MTNFFFQDYAQNITKDDEKLKFELHFDTVQMPFLKDHFFSGVCLVPAAIMIDVSVTAFNMWLPNKQLYPLNMREFKVFRALKIEMGSSSKVTVELKELASQLLVKIKMDKLNSAGNVIRRGVTIASVAFNLGNDINETPRVTSKEELNQLEFEKDNLYGYFIRTHGPLFQTLQNKMALSSEKTKVLTTFNIKKKENDFGTKGPSPFACSPLGVDSLLQTAVLFSVVASPGDSECFFTKLPVEIYGLQMKEPIQMDKNYSISCSFDDWNDEEMYLTLDYYDQDNKWAGGINKIVLKTAPFEKFSRKEVSATNQVLSQKKKGA